MTTLIIHGDSPEAKEFIEFAKTLPFVEECTLDRIPGIPYTMEERMAVLREAETNYVRGVPGIPHEELVERIREKISSWK